MALDTGIYNVLAQPRKSAFEYKADFERQDRDREQAGQQRQLNALAMQQRQGQINDESMTRADAMGVRNVLASGGGAAELRRLGTPDAIKQADAAAQRGRDDQLFGVKMDEAQESSIDAKLKRYANMVSTGVVRDPVSAAQMLRDQYADPVLGPRLQRIATLEQSISNIGQTPEAFAEWSRRTVMGMQGMAKAEAEAEARRTAAMRADMERKRYELEVLRSGRKDVREDARLGIEAEGMQIKRDQAAREKTTGPKLSPVAEKELFEADDLVQSSKSAADSLRLALGLNGKMYSGVEAVRRAKVRSNLPGSDPAADATIAYDNIIGAQGLASLKAVFGGAPTEGERKILIDLQASAEKTPTQREEILRRSIAAVEARAKFNADKAAALRSGGYTAPQQTPQPAGGARQTPAAAPRRQQSAPVMTRTKAEYDALPSGTAYTGPDGKTRMKP